ncbi:Double-stranded RNA-binding protein 5 [Sesamum angolense]|uniref:Double-stranded RNA-binding protein 5 n=1 Tax=Sesamum angolense TaxID=2727404 RepID=A0AAE1XAK9_9LAMI|nr:Double-stranded RNA-binding protein 5 [Sesamum angolense]
MYKSKLQELCHKQKWALPKYTCVRDGKDHCPLFKASVVVSGTTFHTPAACKSSKQAHNDAAQVAFLHFTSAEPSTQRSEYVEKTNNEKEVALKQDFQDEFKKKLQMYTRRKNLDLPVYHSEKEGVSFRATVCIGEDRFQSQELHETVAEAEDAAAQVALLSLSTDAFHQNDQRSYKILLQELTDNEGFFLPMNTTIRAGETFTSTVEVEGEAFQGAAAKSKNLAELHAAKVAYTVFMERKLFQPGYLSPRASVNNIHKHAPPLASVVVSDPEENPRPQSPSNFTSTTDDSYYLLCNRVKIFTCIPNTALPKGTVVLPISENRWTTVSLEFPREKGM